jgi:hypothetical protein
MEKTDRKKASWTFENGDAKVVFPSGISAAFDMTVIPAEIRLRLVEYGFKQKLSDSLAGYEGSDKDKADLLGTMYQQLLEGEWTSRREAQPSIDTSKLRAQLIAQGVPEAVADQIIENSKKEKKAKK